MSIEFELFKSNVCHSLKRMGDIDFMLDVLDTNIIEKYFKKEMYEECFYMLAMFDYVSRENNITLCDDFNHIRQYRFKEPLYAMGVLIRCAAANSEKPKEKSLEEAIPEFKHFNIIEADVRNVC